MRRLIAWREDGTPKRQQLWEEWLKLRRERGGFTVKEMAMMTALSLAAFAVSYGVCLWVIG